jgi:(p)ppGpp synthase/HD superfamily hydrolase
MTEEMIELAEKYCKHFHEGQKRKGNNTPYEIHPFAVRDILKKYGYSDVLTQIVALLHDTLEDTLLNENQHEIEKIFGWEIYKGVYALSKNTAGRHVNDFMPLFKNLGIILVDENKILTPQAYKLRLLFNRDTFKRIKIADMIHNTTDLQNLKLESIKEKISDAETFYIPIGKQVAPIMIKELIENIEKYKHSKHYKENFIENKIKKILRKI